MILLVDEFLYRGPQPRESLAELREIGITDIVSLEYGYMDSLLRLVGIPSEADLIKIQAGVLGMHYHSIRCSDFRHPTLDQSLEFLSLVFSLLDTGRTIFFHCKDGVDRTGWMAAFYRIRKQNYHVDDAIREWEEIGFHKNRFFWWERAFRNMVGAK